MSIKWKTFTILAALWLAFFAITVVVFLRVVLPSFEDLQNQMIARNVERVVHAVEREGEALGRVVADWAAWDDTYEFVMDRNERYARSNLVPGSFEAIGINLLYIVNREGAVVWGRFMDPDTGTYASLPDFPADRLSPDRPLLALAAGSESANGLVRTSRGAMVVASHAILRSDDSGPPRGTLIMGTLMTEPFVEGLRDRMRMDLDLRLVDAGAPDERGSGIEIAEDGDMLIGRTVIGSLAGEPLLELVVRAEKEIVNRGTVTVRYALIVLAVMGIALLAAALILEQRLVAAPLSTLRRHIMHIGETGDLDSKLPEDRHDEVGMVAYALNRMADRIQFLAHHDHLTGLANRALFMERGRHLITVAKRQKVGMAVVYIDLDDFKPINDTHGHQAGDEVLRETARRMTEHLRECDIIARLGGDEFVVIGLDVDERGAVSLGKKIAGLFTTPIDIGDATATVGASIGISLYPRDGTTLEDLMQGADSAMYEAKRGGKGRLVVREVN